MSSTKDWLKHHKSANFFWLIIIVGILLLALGLVIEQSNSKFMGFLSTFIIQLSGAAFATAILTVFLSFRDIRKTLSNTLSDLWIEGEVVNSLSTSTKEKIDKKIILSSKNNTIKSLDQTLYKALTKQRLNCLSSFFIYNFNYDITLKDCTKNPEMLVHNVRCSYRVRKEHLLDGNRSYPLKYYYEISVPKKFNLSKEKFLRHFSIKYDGHEFDKGDVIVEEKSIGTMNAIIITFDKLIEINDYSDIQLNIETLSLKTINDEIYITRYPINGCKITLRYSSDYEFDSCWFNSILGKEMPTLNSDQQTHSDGISVVNNDWILPGNGAQLCWYQKK